MKAYRRVLSIVLCLVCICRGVAAKAEDTNDLRALYEEGLSEKLIVLKTDYEEKTQLLTQFREQCKVLQHSNRLVDTANKEQSKKLQQLSDKSEDLCNSMERVREQVRTLFYSDIEDLISLDNEYKHLSREADSVFKEASKLDFFKSEDIDYAKLETLEDEAVQAVQDYENAKSEYELGEVTGVSFPLDDWSEIRSPWGMRNDPIVKGTVRFHAGIDLRAPMHTGVLALFNGVVKEAFWGPIAGYQIKIDHGDGIMTYYCHLDEIQCEVGQKVQQYEQIALSGNTGSRTTGPHLHFGLYIDGESVDPAVLWRDYE